MRVLSLIVFVIFLTFGLNSSADSTSFNNPIVDASDKGDFTEVKRLLKTGLNPDSEGDFGVTALMRAAFRGHTEIAEFLIKSGAYVNSSDIGGDTPLHMAARSGNPEMVKLLLHYDASVNSTDNQKWTPLMRAIMSKNAEVTSILVNNDADLNIKNNIGNSSIVQAAISGKESVMKVLLGSEKFKDVPEEQKQASVNTAKKRGNKNLSKLISSSVMYYDKKNSDNKFKISSDNKKQESNSGVEMPYSQNKKEDFDNGSLAVSNSISQLEEVVEKDDIVWQSNKDEESMSVITSPYSTEMNNEKDEGAKQNNFNKVPKQKPSQSNPKNIKLIRSSMSYGGNYTIQMGAFSEKEQANFVWQNLKHKHYDLLADLQPTVLSSKGGGGQVLYRLRVGMFANKDTASRKCNEMQSKRIDCFVVKSSTEQYSLNSKAATNESPKNESKVESPYEEVEKKDEESNSYYDRQTNYFSIVPQRAYVPSAPPVVKDRVLEKSSKSDESIEYPSNDSDAPIDTMPFMDNGKSDEDIKMNNIDNENDPSLYVYKSKKPVKSAVKNLYNDSQNDDYQSSNNSQRKEFQNKDVAKPVEKEEKSKQAKVTYIEGKLPWMQQNNQVKSDGLVRREDFAYAANVNNQVAKEHDYTSFYEDVKKEYRAKNKISEAVLVEENSSLPWLEDKGMQSKKKEGIWLEISPFPNKVTANDYADRMFKYDEELSSLQINTLGGDSPYDRKIRLHVGPLQNYGKANMLCNNIVSSGLKCFASGSPSANYDKNSNIKKRVSPGLSKPQYVPKVKKLNNDRDSNKTYWINLGAFSDYHKAEYYLMFLKEDNDDILNGVKYNIDKMSGSDRNSSKAVKLKLGPFYKRFNADNLCSMMRRRNVSCLVIY